MPGRRSALVEATSAKELNQEYTWLVCKVDRIRVWLEGSERVTGS